MSESWVGEYVTQDLTKFKYYLFSNFGGLKNPLTNLESRFKKPTSGDTDSLNYNTHPITQIQHNSGPSKIQIRAS